MFINNQSCTGGSRGIEQNTGKQTGLIIINENQNDNYSSKREEINYMDVKMNAQGT